MELIRAALADRDENGPTRLAVFRRHAVLLDAKFLNGIHRRSKRGTPKNGRCDRAAVQHTVISSRAAPAHAQIAVIAAAITTGLLRYACSQGKQAIHIAA